MIILMVAGFLIFTRINKDTEMIMNQDIIDISLNDKADGVYEGAFEDPMITNAKVSVYIENHTIKNIIIISHEHGSGHGGDIIVDDIIENQSVLVDDIAGATYSSRVLKLAIMDALN